jgi:hypothetical protein
MKLKKLILALFLLGIVFSQGIVSSEIFSSIVGIATLIAVILILLYLGGVIKGFRVGGGTVLWIVYSILILVIFVLPFLQRIGYIKIFPDRINSSTLKKWGFPQNDAYKFPREVCQVLTMLTLQEEIACYMPEIIFLVILPFAAIFAISYGFLAQLKIFKGVPNESGLYRLLAFIMAFSTIPMGIFMILVAFWFSFMGVFSVAIFAAMFIAGVFFRGYGFVSSEYERAIQVSTKIRSELKSLALSKLADIKSKNPTDMYEELAGFLDSHVAKQFLSHSKIGSLRERLSKIDPKKENAKSELDKLVDEIRKEIERGR